MSTPKDPGKAQSDSQEPTKSTDLGATLALETADLQSLLASGGMTESEIAVVQKALGVLKSMPTGTRAVAASPVTPVVAPAVLAARPNTTLELDSVDVLEVPAANAPLAHDSTLVDPVHPPTPRMGNATTERLARAFQVTLVDPAEIQSVLAAMPSTTLEFNYPMDIAPPVASSPPAWPPAPDAVRDDSQTAPPESPAPDPWDSLERKLDGVSARVAPLLQMIPLLKPGR